MHIWLDQRITEEQLLDMVRAAERRRLLKKALAARPRPVRFYSLALVGVGRWLEACGRHLQAHYGAALEAPGATKAGGTMSGC